MNNILSFRYILSELNHRELIKNVSFVVFGARMRREQILSLDKQNPTAVSKAIFPDSTQ